MARIRTIKPEFFRHEELQDLQIKHPDIYPMIVFPALWGHCDKHGVFEWKPRQLQLDIIPFIWEASVKKLVDSMMLLVTHGFIKTYQHDGKVYGYIPTFVDHQRINGKEAQVPSNLPEVSDMIEYHMGEAPEKHPRSTREAVETTGREGNRKGIGREGEQEGNSDLIKPSRSTRKKITDEEWLEEIKANPAYSGISIEVEMGKAQAWAMTNSRKCTRAFLLNWFNRAEKPVNLLPGISPQLRPKSFREQVNQAAVDAFVNGEF